MSKIKNYYIESDHIIKPNSLKSGCLKKLFNISSGSIIGSVNNQKIKSLIIIFEKRCSLQELNLYNIIFLQTIKQLYPSLITVHHHQIYLFNQYLSTFHYHHTKQSGIFCHSFLLQQNKLNYPLTFFNKTPKEFSCEILNSFSQSINEPLIQKK